MKTLRIGDVVRHDKRFDGEGTITEVGAKGAFVKFDTYPESNGWFDTDSLFVVRGSVPPESRASVELGDIKPILN